MIVKCGDSFNSVKLKEICCKLEEGKDVQIHLTEGIHTPMMDFESAHYASELEDIYGDRLVRIKDDNVYHSYKLKDFANVRD